MNEGQEILTTKDRLDFIKRKPFWYGFLFFLILSVLSLLGLLIYGIFSGTHYKSTFISILYILYFSIFLEILHLFQCGRLFYFIEMKNVPKEDFTRFEFYAVIFFQDKLELEINKAFFGCDGYWLDESYDLAFSKIESVQFDNGMMLFTLRASAIDGNPELIKFVGQKFRISKKLSKNDRSRLLDVLKIQIERAKAA